MKLCLLYLTFILTVYPVEENHLQDQGFLIRSREFYKSSTLDFHCLGYLEKFYHIYKRRSEIAEIFNRINASRLNKATEFNNELQSLINMNVGKGKILKQLAVFSNQRSSELQILSKKIDSIYYEAEKLDTDEAWAEAERKVFSLGVPEKKAELSEIRESLGFDSLLSGHKIEEELGGHRLLLVTVQNENTFITAFELSPDGKVELTTKMKPYSESQMVEILDVNFKESSYSSSFSSRFSNKKESFIQVKSDVIISKNTIFRYLAIDENIHDLNYLTNLENILKRVRDFEVYFFEVAEAITNSNSQNTLSSCIEVLKNKNSAISNSNFVKSYTVVHDFDSSEVKSTEK